MNNKHEITIKRLLKMATKEIDTIINYHNEFKRAEMETMGTELSPYSVIDKSLNKGSKMKVHELLKNIRRITFEMEKEIKDTHNRYW
jgi:hypothetical protein